MELSTFTENEPEKRISLAEAANLLEGKLDLMAAREEAVKAHAQWGYIDAMIRAGKLESPEQYRGLFDAVTLSEKDLQIVGADIERGIAYMPILDAGLLFPHEQWKVLFEKIGIPCNPGIAKYSSENLPFHKKVTPAAFKAAGYAINSLHTLNWGDQSKAFKRAYEKTSPLERTGARVFFTPDILDVTRTGGSATRDMQDLANHGFRMLDIGANLIRYRTQMDKGLRAIATEQGFEFNDLDVEGYQRFLIQCFNDGSIGKYLPDQNITRNSDSIYPNGDGVILCFDFSKGGIILGCYPSCMGNDYMGSRLALG